MKEEKITKQDLKNEAVEDGLKGSSGFKAVGITFPDQPIWEEQYSKLSDEKKILLDQNDGPNHLHGGREGLSTKLWDFSKISDNKISFSIRMYTSDDNYPGSVKIIVHLQLQDRLEQLLMKKK